MTASEYWRDVGFLAVMRYGSPSERYEAIKRRRALPMIRGHQGQTLMTVKAMLRCENSMLAGHGWGKNYWGLQEAA